MKKSIWIRIVAMLLVIVLTGCSTPTMGPVDSQHQTDSSTTSTTDQENETTESTDATENTEDSVDPTTSTETAPTEDELSDAQKNSVAMLNYLATLTQEINSSRNSRMFLEEAYASLINNTNPEKVNELTESHLCSLLDTIEKYRIVAVKRERLEYLYNQNKASAIKEAIPNPIAVLSAASSLDLKRLVASVAYMAIDSINSYNSYNNELDQSYLHDGWALDDEAAEALHESRKYAFLFMIEIVRDENLPGELALNESSVEKFVSWTNNTNVHQRLQFLESEEKTYSAFGSYWLELAECYYELEDYKNCLEAIKKYEDIQSDIFRKDYYLAKIMPTAIDAAAQTFSTDEYISVAERYLDILINNTESNEWALRYFAAQVYVDLYTKTQNIEYLHKAYDLTKNNVNHLIGEQKNLNTTYTSDIKEVTTPDNATKQEKNQIKEYNKSLKENRKTELPSIYEPLALNCELLFALAEKIGLSDSEKASLEGILSNNDDAVFLTMPIANRYSFNSKPFSVSATYDKNELTLPVLYVSENSMVKVTITEDGKSSVYDDWKVKTVKRSGTDINSYTVTYQSEKAKDQNWSADTKIEVEILDEAGSSYTPIKLSFKVSEYSKFLFIETVKFEQEK